MILVMWSAYMLVGTKFVSQYRLQPRAGLKGSVGRWKVTTLSSPFLTSNKKLLMSPPVIGCKQQYNNELKLLMSIVSLKMVLEKNPSSTIDWIAWQTASLKIKYYININNRKHIYWPFKNNGFQTFLGYQTLIM